MVAQLTYSSLVQTIESYLDRTDDKLVAMIPQFVKYAEVRIGRELRVTAFTKAVESTFTAGINILEKPADWLETVSFNVGTGAAQLTRSEIVPRTYEYVRAYWPTPANTGTPKYYADYDLDHWLVAPTPSTSAPFELVYYASVPGLDGTQQTNVYTQYCPDLLLYACLLESAPYLKDDERIQTWQQRYDRSLMAEVTDDVRLLIDRALKATENK